MKIFGIGLPKTGTRSLVTSLTLLGYKGIKHHQYFFKWWQNHDNIKNVLKDKGFCDLIKKGDAFSDWPFHLLYGKLDRLYPGSKFILTIRKDKATWERSRKGHAIKRKADIAKGIGNKSSAKPLIKSDYDKHIRKVKKYFKNRPNDFLVMCFEKGDGWKKLCSFLKVTSLNIPFPHRNKNKGIVK